MIVSGVVSIPSSAGSSTVFTVTGTRTLAYAKAFETYLQQSLTNNTLNIVQGDTVAATGAVTFAPPVAGQVNEAVLIGADSVSSVGGLSATVPAGYQFFFDAVSGATTITGAATGGDVLVAGINAAATYLDEGGNNTVVFVDGNNHYVGDTGSNAGSDTVVAGSGFDTIETGVGATTVDSGTGRATITLNDTAPVAGPSIFNDFVYLDDGHNTVYAGGVSDAIVATTEGQTIDGGVGTGQYDGILLATNGGDGNDVVNAGAATVALYDDSSGNSVFGGTGLLYFIGGDNVTATVVGSGGTTYIFGASGDNVVYGSSPNDGRTAFVAGYGNETLNGAQAQESVLMFGGYSTEASVTSGISDVLTGGANNDTLVAGSGSETLTGGGGANLFVINATTDGVGAHITITDFAAGTGNLLGFANYSEAQIQAALAGAVTVTGAGGETDTVLTLSDKTEVTFIGVTSLTGHVSGV